MRHLSSFLILIAVTGLAGCDDSDAPGGGGSGGGDDGGGGAGGEGGQGGSQFQCAIAELDQPLCDGADCPFVEMGAVECNEPYFGLQVATAADGAPVLLLDPAAVGSKLFLADTSVPSVTLLDDVTFHAVLATDEAGVAFASYVPHPEPFPWLHRAIGGTEETVSSAPVAFWVPRGLRVRDGITHAVAVAGGEVDERLVTATRDGDGAWSVVELPELFTWSEVLELADDGTPLLAYRDNDQRAVIRVGDAGPVEITLDEPGQGFGALAIVPAASSWKAAVYQAPNSLVVSLPGGATIAAPAYPALEYATCDPFGGQGCAGPCDEIGLGTSGAPKAFAVPGGVLILFIDHTVDRSGHFQEEPPDRCGGAGCSCQYIVDADASGSDLVAARYDDVSGQIVEIGRWPAAAGVEPAYLDAEARGDTIAFALRAQGRVTYGNLDVAALAP